MKELGWDTTSEKKEPGRGFFEGEMYLRWGKDGLEVQNAGDIS